jgi:hypothetical protein
MQNRSEFADVMERHHDIVKAKMIPAQLQLQMHACI